MIKSNYTKSLLLACVLVLPYFGLRGFLIAGSADAQAGLFILITGIIGGALIFGLAYFICRVVEVKQNRINAERFFAITGCLVLFGVYGITIKSAYCAVNAYTIAAAPDSAPEELSALIGYDSGLGYEIDNLLAKNPSSPAALLDQLSRKQDQLGTLMALAANEKASVEMLNRVLSSVPAQHQHLVIDSLARNPRFVRGELSVRENKSGRVVVEL